MASLLAAAPVRAPFTRQQRPQVRLPQAEAGNGPLSLPSHAMRSIARPALLCCSFKGSNRRGRLPVETGVCCICRLTCRPTSPPTTCSSSGGQ